MNLLQTQFLSIGYMAGSTKVLQRDLNLGVQPGEIISLMGQNGVGKTTFIRTVSGLIPPLDGEVRIAGESLSKLSPSLLSRRLSLVLTEKPFSFNMSVLELIALGRHPYSNWLGVLSPNDKDQIESALTVTNTNYLADKKLYELSDGQLQKVMIARALAQETDLIILDEPGAHLDLYNKIELMKLLRQIANQGKGILISTHDLQLSTQLSDRLWLFNFNQPVVEGIPEDLILDGSLEKTLYLNGTGFDLIHGTLEVAASGPHISLEGDEKIVYWTSQALKRQGFLISSGAALRILCSNAGWELHSDATNRAQHFTTIRALIESR